MLRAYLGRLMFSVILALTAVVVAVLLRDHAPWQWVMAASLLAWALTVYLSTLWKCKSIRYQLSSQRLIITSGLLSKHVDELELFRVKDILVSQNIWQRLLNYGTITILSTDDTTPQLVMPHIHEPLKAKEVLREAYHEARRAANLRTTEFIQS
ncbi:MAG: PH domain-containing protein [bacterium]|nr:PH domain-containing protein [bacterium]